MGSKGSQTTTQTQEQQYSAHPAVASAGTQAISMAKDAAGQPFQMPAAPVAGFNPYQTQAFSQILSGQNMAQPYFDQGRGMIAGSATPVSAQDVENYYNPMADNVTRQMQNIFGQQQKNTTGQLTQAAGGVGADRIAVGQAELANQQGLAAGQTYAGLYQQALQAAQQQKQLQQSAGFGIAQMGPAAQNAYFSAASALGGAGNQMQQQSQAELNSPYQQELARIAYPFQTAQYLAGITGGVAPALGGTTTGKSETTQPAPSALSQILGGVLGGVGVLGGMGGFGGGKGASAGTPTGATFPAMNSGGYGVGSYGGVPVPTYFADGGGVEAPEFPALGSGLSPIPSIPLKPGGGEFHNNMRFAPPPSSGGGGGGGGGGDGSKIAEIIGTAAKIIPMFLADGGTVNPYDFGRGFDDGGGIGAPDTFNDRWIAPQQAPASVASPFPVVPTEPYGIGKKVDWSPDQANAPANVEAGEPAEPAVEQGYPRPQRYPVAANADLPAPEAYQAIPASYKPYPDATERDWGQRLVRSPWMALVKAGAAMAQTRGPIGSAIGAGLQAGAGELESQRKELRTEQQINEKAQSLYQSAKFHLDQYQRMTPYQQATIEREKYQWQPGTGIDPATGKMVSGAYRLPTKSGEQPQFVPGVTISGRGAGAGPTALQRNIEYLVASGIAPTKAAAHDMLRKSVNDPAIFGRLVQAEKNLLIKMPDYAGARPEEIEAAARRNVIARQREAATPPAATQGAQPPAEPAANQPLPMPADKSQLVPGKSYSTPRGVGVWDGEKFNPV